MHPCTNTYTPTKTKKGKQQTTPIFGNSWKPGHLVARLSRYVVFGYGLFFFWFYSHLVAFLGFGFLVQLVLVWVQNPIVWIWFAVAGRPSIKIMHEALHANRTWQEKAKTPRTRSRLKPPCTNYNNNYYNNNYYYCYCYYYSC